MKHIDRILDIIDTGLQTAGDASYGHDTAGVCWRCLTATTDHPDAICDDCRLDLTVGPVHGPWLYGGPVCRDDLMPLGEWVRQCLGEARHM